MNSLPKLPIDIEFMALSVIDDSDCSSESPDIRHR